MRESLNNDDYKTILKIGHNIKGFGGGYGFGHISEIGKAIEEAAENKNTEEIQNWLNKLLNYLESIHIVYG